MNIGLRVLNPSRGLLFAQIAIIFTFLVVAVLPSFAAPDYDDRYPKSERKLVSKARRLSQKGHIAEAKIILEGVIASNPDNSRAKLELAYISLRQRDFTSAYDTSFDIAKNEPKNAYAFAVLGATSVGVGDFQNSRTLLYNAINLDKKEALAWASLGMLEFYQNRIDESLRNLRQAVYRDPNEPNFIYALAQVSARAEKYKDAADAYRRFLRISSRKDKERRDRIKGLIRFLTFLGRRPRLYEIRGANRTEVKINLVNSRPIIKVRVKKKGDPLNFVLDTGSGISVISKKTAKRLHIKSITKGGIARALGGDGKFEIVYGYLKKIYVGDATIKNVPVYIREFHNKNEEVDGYIGLSLISKYITTIDYPNRKFILERKNSIAPRLSEEGEDVVSPLPLRITSSGFLSGEVKIEGIEAALNFIVDTGASISVISKALAGSRELSDFPLGEKMSVIGAAGITNNVSSFILPRLSIGAHSRQNLQAIALDLNMINETAGFEQAGILGGNFLRNYSVTFDFKELKVTFTPQLKN